VVSHNMFWLTVRSSLWHDVSSVVVCNACIVAKSYVVGGRRWYRWIGR